jgi:hypothetical protein
MTIFDPVLNCKLDTLARENLILAMPHCDILDVQNNQRFFHLLERLACNVLAVNLGEKVFNFF